MTEDFPDRTVWTARYHVPRSQVHEGSRGSAAGNVHLHAPAAGCRLLARAQRAKWLTRKGQMPLCGKPRGWYERPPLPAGGEARCPKCVSMAERYGVTWPAQTTAGGVS